MMTIQSGPGFLLHPFTPGDYCPEGQTSPQTKGQDLPATLSGQARIGGR